MANNQVSRKALEELERDRLVSGELSNDSRFEEWHQMNSNLLHDWNLIRSDHSKAIQADRQRN